MRGSPAAWRWSAFARVVPDARRYPLNASFGALVVPMLVQGVAMSTFFVSMITILLRDVPPAQTPSASGLSNFVRITAGGFAASLTTAFWDRREALQQTHLADAQPSAPRRLDPGAGRFARAGPRRAPGARLARPAGDQPGLYAGGRGDLSRLRPAIGGDDPTDLALAPGEVATPRRGGCGGLGRRTGRSSHRSVHGFDFPDASAAVCCR